MTAEALRQKDLGNACFKEKRYHKAIFHYTESLQSQVDPLVLGNRAQAHINLSSWYPALVDCNKALKINSKLPKLLFRRAVVLEKLELYQLALADAKRALAIFDDPGTRALIKRVEDKKNSELIQCCPYELGDELRSEEPLKEIQIECLYKPEVEIKKEAVLEKPKLDDSDIPRVPTSFSVFLSHYELLKREPSIFSKYFLRISFSDYSKLFDDLFESDIFSCLLNGFVGLMDKEYLTDEKKKEIAECLLRLTSVARFDMVIMFMSTSDKKNLHALCDKLHALDSSAILAKFA